MLKFVILIQFLYLNQNHAQHTTVHTTKIANFYNQLTPIWEDVWGDHLHHGFYGNRSNRVDPQVRMMEETLKWVNADHKNKYKSILDAGCGLGSSSRYLSTIYPFAFITGVSLSSYQIERAQNLTHNRRIRYYVRDVTNPPLGWTNKFDLIWSLESAEHFIDKRTFIAETRRILSINGKIVVVTWCVSPNAGSFTKFLLNIIDHGFHTASWTSRIEYKKLFDNFGFSDYREEIWTNHVLPFWTYVILSALSPFNLVKLASRGPSSIASSIALYTGYFTGGIEFVIMSAVRS